MERGLNFLTSVLVATAVFLGVFVGGLALADEVVKVVERGKIKVVIFKMNDYNYYLEDTDGSISKTKMDVAPYIKQGRTFVPVRFLSNALGIPDGERIGWNQQTKTVTLVGNKTVKMTIGSKKMYSDVNTITMDVVPELNKGRTMLLARYVAEGLGYIVDWDANRQLVICYPEDKPKPDLTKIIEVIEKKPAPGSVEARFEAIGKAGGFTRAEQLTDEMAEYICEREGREGNITVSDTTWARHKPVITIENLGDIRVNGYTYKVNTVVPTRVGARKGPSYGWKYIEEDDIHYVVIVNGKLPCTVNVKPNFDAELDAGWGAIGSENIFIEGSEVPEWVGVY